MICHYLIGCYTVALEYLAFQSDGVTIRKLTETNRFSLHAVVPQDRPVVPAAAFGLRMTGERLLRD